MEVEQNENLLPEKGDTLFKEYNEDYRHNAMVKVGISKFFLYSDSYKVAAIKLFEQLNGDAFIGNSLIYPIVFTCRHFIELRLKELISGLNYTNDEEYSFPEGHDLVKLFQTYKSVLRNMGEDMMPQKLLLTATENIIKEFNSVDPNSMCFRYPVNKMKEPHPTLKITSLDLENFRLVMDKLFNFFDEQSEAVFYLIDMAEEYFSIMRQEYYREMESYYNL